MKNEYKIILEIIFVVIIILCGISISYLIYGEYKNNNECVFELSPDYMNQPHNVVKFYNNRFVVYKTKTDNYEDSIYYEGKINKKILNNLIDYLNENVYDNDPTCKYVLTGKKNTESSYKSYCLDSDDKIKEILNYTGKLWYVE